MATPFRTYIRCADCGRRVYIDVLHKGDDPTDMICDTCQDKRDQHTAEVENQARIMSL